jgi:sugar lactone lactonase YvrE
VRNLASGEVLKPSSDMKEMQWIEGLGLVCLALALGANSPAAVTISVTSTQDLGSLAVNASIPASTIVSYQISGASSPLSFQLGYGTEFSLGQAACTGTPATSCTVTVSFTPKYPGIREDAVQILDSGGNLVATTLLHGVGLGSQALLQPGTIMGFAGTGMLGTRGDNQAAISAELSNPQGVAVDSAGNVYIADALAQVVRKVNAAGVITTVAGNPAATSLGDGGPATSAGLYAPTGVAVDGAGNLYIADSQNNLIRRVDAVSGLITTVAGNGTVSSTFGDGTLATQASLNTPSDVAVDPAGNLYIADQYNNCVRRVDAGTGVITTVAGGGNPDPGTDGLGDGGLAVNAVLNDPSSVALDSSGNLYIADSGNNLIREVSSGIISVVAGNGSPAYGGDGGAAIQAALNEPTGVRVDAAGNLYIADSYNGLIRKVNGAGVISTLAGQANQFGFNSNGIPANLAQLFNPTGIAIDSSGNIYIADEGNSMVREIVPGPVGLTFVSTGVGEISSPQTVSIANIGNEDLNIGSFSLMGSFLQQSSGTIDCSAGMAVAPAESCSVAVTFAPQTLGSLSGTLSLLTDSLNAVAGFSEAVALSGSGIGITTSDPTVNITTLSFGDQTTGVASAAQAVTISNPGATAVNVGVPSISGSNGNDFSYSTTCPIPLPAYRSCTVSVIFMPQAPGTRTATLNTTEADAASGAQFSQSVFLQGTGIVAPPVVSPAVMSFNNGGTGNLPVTQTATLTNPSSVTLGIFSISSSRPDLFSISTTCQSSLAPLSSCAVSVTFTPTTSPVDPATLTFTFSSGSSQTVTLTTANPVLAFTGPTSSLGPQTRELRSLPVPFGLQNLSSSPVTVNTITIGGANASDFAQVNNCGTSIPAGQGCTIWLTYLPIGSSPVSSSAAIIVTDSAPGSPHSIAVSGTATGLSQAAICVDTPQFGHSVAGVIPLSGWALSDNAAITGIALAVDGVALGSATYGTGRADVCTVFPNRAGCPNVGWSSSLDTTTLADGVHTLSVMAMSSLRNTTLATVFTVNNVAAGTNHSTRVFVDFPNASSPNLAGTVALHGWAMDGKSAIKGVSIFLDGSSLESATYGLKRLDVCNFYPGSPSCPNVGWSAALNTTKIPDGTHTASFQAQTADGRFSTVSTTFTVANGTTASPVSAFIDYPNSNPVNGILVASGWAVDPSSAIASISLSVDGVSQGLASFTSRPDVCNYFGNSPGCPNVGWRLSVDTTKFADGTHNLGLVVTSGDARHKAINQQFVISNVKHSAATTTAVAIDFPNATSGVLSGQVRMSGWAIDRVTAISTVTVAIDGIPFATVQPTVARPDVCAFFSSPMGCPTVGWQVTLDTTSLLEGQHTLQITATSQQGRRATVLSGFRCSNAARLSAQGEGIDIDVPSFGAQLSGIIPMSGWAIDKVGDVQQVSIAVDGVLNGMAQYGAPRPDVCAFFGGSYNCPGVGWKYALDTTLLSNGPHTLQAIEYGSNGNAVVSQAILVSNVSAPFHISIDTPSWNSTYRGMLQVSGWAIDDIDSIKQVSVSVDGLPIGPAVYGTGRPDVCNVYLGRAGCPNVGWTFPLDTTEFSNGTHFLQIAATSSRGVHSTLSIPFVTAN